VDEISLNLSLVGRHYSIDAPVHQSEDMTLLDVLQNDTSMAPDGVLNSHSLQTEIDRVLATLTCREADILTLFYGLKGQASLGLEEIGVRFSITQERVRQIKEKALGRLRRRAKGSALKSFLK
jgi:RNA polymerase primary sigma factor